MARSKTTTDRILSDSRAQAALDRKDYFAQPGATAAGWRGGRASVQTDRRKKASKNACRGKVRY